MENRELNYVNFSIFFSKIYNKEDKKAKTKRYLKITNKLRSNTTEKGSSNILCRKSFYTAPTTAPIMVSAHSRGHCHAFRYSQCPTNQTQ